MVSGFLSSVEGSLIKATPNLNTYANYFDKVFPYYLSLGMSYEDFWEKDCQLVKAYEYAYKSRMRDSNMMAWLNGRYVYDAFGAIMTNAFSRNKAKYTEHPYDLFAEDKEIREEAEMKRNADNIMMQFVSKQKAKDAKKG